MKRRCIVPRATAVVSSFAAAILAGVLLSSAPARADLNVHVDIRNAPPPPHIVFHARPHEVFYPGQRVYVVDDPGVGDSDCFRYGGYYWVFREGYWYRSARWRGPFMVVHPRYVPQAFYRVPATRWKHHPGNPPGPARRGRQGPDRRDGPRDAPLNDRGRR